MLVAADKLVNGVAALLPPLVDPVGVVVMDEGSVEPPFCLAACLAAFSARRFCLDADAGAMGL